MNLKNNKVLDITPKPRGYGQLPSDLEFRRNQMLQGRYEGLYDELFGSRKPRRKPPRRKNTLDRSEG